MRKVPDPAAHGCQPRRPDPRCDLDAVPSSDPGASGTGPSAPAPPAPVELRANDPAAPPPKGSEPVVPTAAEPVLRVSHNRHVDTGDHGCQRAVAYAAPATVIMPAMKSARVR